MSQKILVIEDDTLLGDILVQKLTNEGYGVELARDGAVGLSKISSFMPDLILLDIILPTKNGYEILEEKHILYAVKKLVPQAELVKGSCYDLEQKEEKIKTIYLELEKRDGTLFSLAERQELKRELEEQLKYRIEKLMPPIFMIRNEEEVL